GRGELGDPLVAGRREWRVTNGIGGFAAGTASGELARYRHGLLIAALAASDHPTLLLSKLSATLEIGDRSWVLDTSRWTSGALDRGIRPGRRGPSARGRGRAAAQAGRGVHARRQHAPRCRRGRGGVARAGVRADPSPRPRARAARRLAPRAAGGRAPCFGLD